MAIYKSELSDIGASFVLSLFLMLMYNEVDADVDNIQKWGSLTCSISEVYLAECNHNYYTHHLLLPVNCPALSNRAHGRLSTTGTSAGSVVHIDCDDGYTFDPTTGSPTVICGASGSWNSTLGSCKKGLYI